MTKGGKSPQIKSDRFANGSDSRYSELPTENESNNSGDLSSSDNTFDSMYSDGPTEPNSPRTTSPVASFKSPPLRFSADDVLMQKQIQYLQHSPRQKSNDVDQKQHIKDLQSSHPEIEYITDQLKRIKQRREVIHKRVEDEVMIEDRSSNLKSSGCSINAESSDDHSSCLDASGVGNNSSIYLTGMMDSLNLSDIEFKK